MGEYEYLFSGFRHAPQEMLIILREIPDELEDEPLKKDGWSAHQVIFHLQDVGENVYIPRLNQILEQSNPVFPDFDTTHRMETHYDPLTPRKELLDDFKSQCDQTVDLLEGLSDEDWNRPGTHISLGTHSLSWWADRMLAHIEEHLSQLRGN